MEYTVVGFPRIGEHRELKFITEKYFRKEIKQEELLEEADRLKIVQWQIQKQKGESFIPSHDFSLYDGMLDTAFLFNAIPSCYQELGLSELDTYFAMARGYQGQRGDVTALAMKKWFNTNYHYMVPELEDDMEISPRPDLLLHDFRLALSVGIETKPIVIGPFTFLKLAQVRGRRQKVDFVPALTEVYCKLLMECEKEGVHWLQIEEPALVMDLGLEDIQIFIAFYEAILNCKGKVKVLLQTYFGDVRDCYQQICELPFDGIGLDFVEGKQTESLIRMQGFPNDKILFAGLINGKNIWTCQDERVLGQLKELTAAGYLVVLNTSCSLLHVPYTLKNETQLPSQISRHFSFAYEKLDEMKELCRLYELEHVEEDISYQQNICLFAESDLRTDKKVQEAVVALTEEDFTRAVPRKERQKLQREILKQPLFPTTTIGSFPQTKEVKKVRADYRKGKISQEEYTEKIQGFIKDCIAFQEEIDLDVLVHGEYERNDMVEFFGEHLSGFVFTENGWVQSYGTRGVKPPIIFGDISRKEPITVSWISYSASLTDKPVKGMLTGPVTILNWSFPREDISSRDMMYQLGLAIREEVLDLEKAGIPIIQIDEAALREKLPLRREDWHRDYLDFAIRAFRLCHAKVQPQTQIHTHMCYSEFEDIIPEIDAMDADVITFEASRSGLTILDSLRENQFETEVGPGVYDIHSPRVPSVREIVEKLQLMVQKLPVENLWVNPDCGLKTRGEEETKKSLQNMVAAAKQMRDEIKEIKNQKERNS